MRIDRPRLFAGLTALSVIALGTSLGLVWSLSPAAPADRGHPVSPPIGSHGTVASTTPSASSQAPTGTGRAPTTSSGASAGGGPAPKSSSTGGVGSPVPGKTVSAIRLDGRILSVTAGSVVVVDFPTGIGEPDTLRRVLLVDSKTQVWLQCVPYQRGSDTGLQSGDEISYMVELKATTDNPPRGIATQAIRQIVAGAHPRCSASVGGTGP